MQVASASIGQVYKGILKDGREVAVKVQRPAVLGQIALDLHVLRLLTPIQVMIKSIISRQKTSQADIESSLALVDEWGRGFVAEVRNSDCCQSKPLGRDRCISKYVLFLSLRFLLLLLLLLLFSY